MIGVSSIIAGAAKPISDVINKFISRKEDQLLAQAEIDKIQNDLETKILDKEKKVIMAQKDLILAEVKGNAFQRNWRPALMWIIIFILANNYLIAPLLNNIIGLFGPPSLLPILELPDKLFNLMTIGLGGYVVGRSAEKIVPQLAEVKAMSNISAPVIEENKIKKHQVKEAIKNTPMPTPGPRF